MDELYFKAREKLSSALSEVPLMRNSLEAIRNELYSKHYEISAPPPGPHGLQCNYVLDATLNIRGALRCLADIIQRYDQSQHALNFVNVVNELLPEGYTTLREKYAIIEFLAQHCESDNLASYYAEAVGRDPRRLINDAACFVNTLVQEIGGDDSLRPLVHALELIADDLADPAAHETCRGFAEMIAMRVDESDPVGDVRTSQMEHLRIRRSTVRKDLRLPTVESAYIVLLLDPSDIRPRDDFWLSCWLFYGEQLISKLYTAERPLNLMDVRLIAVDLINDALELAEQRRSPQFRPLVEFILPREQINLPVESWYKNARHRSLATQFAVVVRDLQRQQDASQRLACRNKWRHIEELPKSTGVSLSKWITCSDEPHATGELYRKLLADSVIAVGLTFPPEYSIHQFQLDELLDTGMPVALWPHRCDHGQDVRDRQASKAYSYFKLKLAEMGAGLSLHELPEIIYELRKSVIDSNADDGVALLWDDPRRIVKPSQYRLASPRRSGLAQ